MLCVSFCQKYLVHSSVYLMWVLVYLDGLRIKSWVHCAHWKLQMADVSIYGCFSEVPNYQEYWTKGIILFVTVLFAPVVSPRVDCVTCPSNMSLLC